MSINTGAQERCGIFYGEEEMCQGFFGEEQFFGCGEPPRVNNMARPYSGNVYQFVVEDFTSGFTDPDQDNFLKTTIETLPEIGIIKYNGAPIIAGFEFNLSNVVNLTYELESGYTIIDGGYCVEGDQCYGKSRILLTFKTSDDSDQELYSSTANFAFVLSAGNTAPVVSDNQDNLVNSEYTFSEGSFTKDYEDAEGDTYKDVVIEETPPVGYLEYQGTAVTSGYRFLVADVTSLKYILPDNYAVYEGRLYEFESSLDTIIQEYLDLGYLLTTNSKGVLKFSDIDNNDFQSVSGTLVDTSIRFRFSIIDSAESQSEPTVFTLFPTGDVNVELSENQSPKIEDIRIRADIGVTTPITVSMINNSYSDKEGDPWIDVRVDAISGDNTGEFRVNGNLIFAEQVIARSVVEDNLFVHIGTNENDFKTDRISISVRDKIDGPWIS